MYKTLDHSILKAVLSNRWSLNWRLHMFRNNWQWCMQWKRSIVLLINRNNTFLPYPNCCPIRNINKFPIIWNALGYKLVYIYCWQTRCRTTYQMALLVNGPIIHCHRYNVSANFDIIDNCEPDEVNMFRWVGKKYRTVDISQQTMWLRVFFQIVLRLNKSMFRISENLCMYSQIP